MKPDRFTEMGIAALLPGMQYMLDQMQSELNRIRQTLGAFQQRAEDGSAEQRLRLKNYWATMTPEQRRVEMARRQAVARKKTKTNNHPRNPNHPGHKKWVKLMTENRWRAKRKANGAAA